MNSDGTGNGWTREQNKTFENVLAIYSGDDSEHWERIAAEFTGKTTEEVRHHYQLLVEDVNAIESGSVPLPCYDTSSEDTSNAAAVALCNIENQGQTQTDSSNERRPLKSDHERRRGIAWTEEEHRLFLRGLEMYGKGDWKSISRYCVLSRTPTQVASHAQKYYNRLNATNKERRRSSIYDITISDDGDTSAPQGLVEEQIKGVAEAGSSNKAGTSMPFTPTCACVHDTPVR